MKETAYAIAGLLLLAALYLGSYCAMVTPDRVVYGPDGLPKPDYRFGGQAAETFYGPAFAVDRWCRPKRWPERLTNLRVL